MKTTLQMTFDHLARLYGQRNAMMNRSDREHLFYDAVRHLSKCVRKGEQSPDVLATALASMFARAFGWADSFNNLPIVEMLAQKYPPLHCAYCNKQKCGCELDRRRGLERSSDRRPVLWDIADWCQNIDMVYGKINIERGISVAIGRLTEETLEVASSLITDTHNRNMELEDMRLSLASEFADVFAWIFAISGILSINLQKTVDERYASCRRCNKMPCGCGPFWFYSQRANAHTQVGGHAETRVAQ